MTDLQSDPEQHLQNLEVADFMNSAEFPKNSNSPKNWNSRTRQNSNSQNKEGQIPAPRQIPINKLRLTSMVWNISIGHLGLAVWLCSLPAPAHLFISWIREIENVLDFLATTKNISVINILLVLNQNTAATGRKINYIPAETRTKHYLETTETSVCYQHHSSTKPKRQHYTRY